jgi:hypothetical protein
MSLAQVASFIAAVTGWEDLQHQWQPSFSTRNGPS